MSCRSWSNARGNVLLQTIIVVGVISSGFYFLVSQINTQKNVVLETDSLMQVRFALHSLVDYTIFGVRQRYCFSELLLPEICTLTHVASSERVLMSQQQQDLLNARLAGSPASAPLSRVSRLKSFSRETPLDRFSATHPLFPLVQKLARKIKDAKIKILVQREESELVPRAGQETYLLVTASLVDTRNREIVSGNNRLSITSYLTAYPRELGTFALMIAKDLRLDLSYDQSLSPGDVSIHSFDPTAGYTFPPSGKGLSFLSPVFINENIHLPHKSGAYTPVTFGDRIFLGNGEVKSATKTFTPSSPGGENERFWSDKKGFGGFQGGISIDGLRDKGLAVFAGMAPSIPADATLMQTCILRNMVKADVNIMKRSALYGHLSSATATSANYRLGLTEGNSFTSQGNVMPPVDVSQWRGTHSRLPEGRGALVDVRVRMGSRNLRAHLSEGGVLDLLVEPGSDAYQTKLRNDLSAAQAALPQDPAAVAAAQSALDAFMNILQVNRPRLKLALKPASIGGNGPQPHLLDLEVITENPNSFLDSDGRLVPITFEIHSFDGTFANSQPIGVVNPKLVGLFTISQNGLGFQFPDALKDSASNPKDIPLDTTDYFTLDKKCEELRGSSGVEAFGAAPWNADFSGQTRERSWNFAGNSATDPYNVPIVAELIFNSTWLNSGPDTFKVRSIVGICRILSEAEIVAGFYACDELIIENRSKPLRIIGTFIVGSMSIAPSALVAGITWSSIYHPQATLDLRKARVLRAKSGVSCSLTPKDAAGRTIPHWHPEPSIRDAQDRFSCNSISLREKAANFRWTTVDPDCGIQIGASSTSCKNRIVHHLLLEHARGGGL